MRVPVILAPQEAEAGESLEPGGRKLQWAKITPLEPRSEQDSVSEQQQQQNETGLITCIIPLRETLHTS